MALCCGRRIDNLVIGETMTKTPTERPHQRHKGHHRMAFSFCGTCRLNSVGAGRLLVCENAAKFSREGTWSIMGIFGARFVRYGWAPSVTRLVL